MNAYGSLELDAAYIRVSTARAFKSNVQSDPEQPADERMFITYEYGVFLDAAARSNSKNPLEHGSGMFEWDVASQSNIMSACYAHLKAQDTYAGAVDC